LLAAEQQNPDFLKEYVGMFQLDGEVQRFFIQGMFFLDGRLDALSTLLSEPFHCFREQINEFSTPFLHDMDTE
jgi:hypothetical protein